MLATMTERQTWLDADLTIGFAWLYPATRRLGNDSVPENWVLANLTRESGFCAVPGDKLDV